MYRKNLLALNIPADICGFEYLNYAIEIYEPRQSIIKLYDDVSKKFNTTRTRAERGMRHAISKTGEKITVGQFISKYKILWEEN